MRWCLVFAIVLALSVVSQAQEAPVAFRLLMEGTELHTGQSYTVALRIDAADIWAFSAKIDYDPTLLYIVGTQAGQPLKPAPILNNADGMTIFNRVQNNRLEYVYSRLSPAASASFNDTVATFQIYPLKAGMIGLKVSSAEANRISFKMDGGQRLIDTQTTLPVGANELILTIIGDAVLPPLEATATPLPQPTDIMSVVGVDVGLQATASVPTLIPVSSSLPTALPQSASETPASAQDYKPPLLAFAFGLMSFALMGLLSLWLFNQRGRDKE